MLILYFLEFIAFILLILHPWGVLILGKKENDFIKINTGLVAVVVAYFLLALLKLNFLILPVLFVPLIYLLLRREVGFSKIKINLLVVCVIVLVVLIQSLINITSGDVVGNGLRLIGTHQNDSLWIAALSQSIQNGIPPANPGLPQTPVQNYHYFLDIFIATVAQLTKIPILTLYLKIISPFLLLLFTASAYIFIHKLTRSRRAALGGVVILSLTSNLYYLVPILYPNSAFNPSVFWVNEYETHIVNPPLLISYSILLTIFYLLFNKKISLILLGFLTGTLVAFKSFASVVLIPSLGVIALIDLFRKKYFFLKLTIVSSLVSFIIYLCINGAGGSIIIFQPLYLIQTMMVTGDHLGNPIWALKLQTYLAENNIKRVVQLYVTGITIFAVGNLGLRLLGLGTLFIKKVEKEVRKIILLLILISLFGTLASLIVVFRGIAWNEVQFFYYTVFSLSLLTIIFLHKLSQRSKNLALLLFVFTWISLIPGVIFISQNYLSQLSVPTTNQELTQASIFLAEQGKGIVLINPKYQATSFIPAVSGQQTFITNPGILDMQLINYQRQREEIDAFFGIKNIDANFLKNNNIKYILTDTDELPRYDQKLLPVIYNSGNIAILRFDNPSPPR